MGREAKKIEKMWKWKEKRRKILKAKWENVSDDICKSNSWNKGERKKKNVNDIKFKLIILQSGENFPFRCLPPLIFVFNYKFVFHHLYSLCLLEYND